MGMTPPPPGYAPAPDGALGIPAGIAALVPETRVLWPVRQYPAVRGRTHAWGGIVAGGLFCFGDLIPALVPLAACHTQGHH